MGVVYKARQPQIGSTVAIKILRGDVIADKRDMERLLDEARVVNAIKHRGIINIFGAGELSDGRQYLVMEYLDGETLEKRLERVGQLTTADAIPILDEVLAALAAAHGTGIVHRDLKPANIFLVKQSDGPDLVKLLDFGLARRQMQEVSRIAGTPDYISPEHARGRPAGPPADLYGFGVLAYHLLTGQLPFKGNSPMEMMEQHVHSAPPVPAEVNPTIPPAMSGLILALLEKDPAKRPDADRAKRDLKAAGRQLQKSSPDGSTPKEGHPALTHSSAADLDPRLKELARKADRTKLLRTLARNWPWVLAGLGLLWIAGVVIWMLLTPTVPVPPPVSVPIKKVAAPVPVVPVKAAPVPAPEPEPAPAPKAEEPIEVKPFEEPAAAVPPAEVPAEKPAEKPAKTEKADRPPRDTSKAALKEETALNAWRLKMKNQIAVLDSRLTGTLDQFRPALNVLSSDIEHVTTTQGQQSAEGRLKSLKEKVEKESEGE
jgi:eukaryotic-like serine/threonine-protein kinase